MSNDIKKVELERLTSVSLRESDRAWLLRYGGFKRGIEELIKQDKKRKGEK